MEKLKKILFFAWNRKFGQDYRKDKRKIKNFYSSNSNLLFQVIYSLALENWYKSPAGQKRYDKPKCFFCDRHDEFNLVRVLVKFKHLHFVFNLKFVDKHHFLIFPRRHDEFPSKKDIEILWHIAKKTGLSIMGNFRDSGAGYPSHVHYQSLDTDFPITERRKTAFLKKGILEISLVDYPVFEFFLKINSKKEAKVVSELVSKLPCPYNPLICSDGIYICPRTRSVPSNIGGFKFAASEVFGKVYCRSMKLFNLLSRKNMEGALLSVCIPKESKEAESYKRNIENLIKEVL